MHDEFCVGIAEARARVRVVDGWMDGWMDGCTMTYRVHVNPTSRFGVNMESVLVISSLEQPVHFCPRVLKGQPTTQPSIHPPVKKCNARKCH